MGYATQDRGLGPESEPTARGVRASSFIANATSTATPTFEHPSWFSPCLHRVEVALLARPPQHCLSASALQVEILLRTPHTVISALGTRIQSRCRSDKSPDKKKIADTRCEVVAAPRRILGYLRVSGPDRSAAVMTVPRSPLRHRARFETSNSIRLTDTE